MAFPTSIDNLSNTRASAGTDKLSSPNHLTHHVAEDTAVEALENKVGIDNSAVVSSIDYLLKNVNSINPGHKHNVLSALDGSPAQAVYVDGAGNVGIGTTSPTNRLTVDGGAIDFSGTTGTFSGSGSGIYQAATNELSFVIAGSRKVTIDNQGNVGIGITDPSAKLDINSDILRLRTAKTPASAGAAGNQGDICWDASYVYVCISTNVWKRAGIATW